jgi:phosphate:Na+ symporter
MKNESKIDNYEDHIGSYLMKLTTTQHLSEDDKKAATMHLQGIGEFERLADHASYLANASLEIQEKNIVFSEHAKLEIHNIMEASKEIADLAYEAYKTRDVATARKIEPLQNVVSVMVAAFKEYHVERLTDGTCTAEAGFVFNDILFSCGRIADHAQNIAAIVLRVSDINLDSRKYMHDIKLHKTPETEAAYEGYYQKYMGTIDKPTLQYVEAPETEETEDDD